jgi:hypothetical protein
LFLLSLNESSRQLGMGCPIVNGIVSLFFHFYFC